MKKLVLLWTVLGALAVAQTATVRASGDGVVSVKPDKMALTVSVVTQADTAQQASEDNAARSTAVLDALRKLLGLQADLRTTGYSVTPVYKYPSGGTPILSGYSASHSIEVTTTDLSIAGRLIDVAVQAGSTTVSGIRFGLKDPQPARQAALKLAVQQAKSSAEAMASGLNMRVGAVITLAESSTGGVISNDRASTAAMATTPVETGMVEVRASVAIEAALVQ
jgi:hypothetical protein